MHQQRYRAAWCPCVESEPFGGSGYTCGGLCVCHALGWRRCCLKRASRLNKTTKRQEQCPTTTYSLWAQKCRCALYNLDGIIMPYMLNSFYSCQKSTQNTWLWTPDWKNFYNFISFLYVVRQLAMELNNLVYFYQFTLQITNAHDGLYCYKS